MTPDMEWLNLHASVLDSPEVVGSDPVERGTWLMLLRYCIGQENGGVIESCRDWKDRKWQQIVRVTLKEVTADSDLWSWSEENLKVTHYPMQSESSVKAKREAGRLGGRGKTKAKRRAEVNHMVPVRFKQNESEDKANEERKERKGKDKEKEEKVISQTHARKDEIPTLDEVKSAAKNGPTPITEECAIAFFDTQEANGWITKNGFPIADWRAALRRYASLWMQNERGIPKERFKARQTTQSPTLADTIASLGTRGAGISNSEDEDLFKKQS